MYSLIAPGAVGPSMRIAQRWMLELSLAVNYMHEHGFVHRDIKPENILLHNDAIRLCDFGLSCQVGTTWGGRAPGTRPYMAPETLQGAHTVDTSQDVWSLGVVLCGILFADLPWAVATVSDPNYADYIEHGSLRAANILSAPMSALLHGMLHPTPSERLTMLDVWEFFSAPRPWLREHEKSVSPLTLAPLSTQTVAY